MSDNGIIGEDGFYIEGAEWSRSTAFTRPWRLSPYLYSTGYGRRSRAIVDATDAVIAFLDPSEEEYAVAIDDAAAEAIIKECI